VGLSNAELTATVQADFDQIALLSDTGWNHNKHYHAYLMRHAPVHCAWALDIGCGKGSFPRLLATRSDRVLALDLSPQMIRIAKEEVAAALKHRLSRL
jgi:2-polyprenyl-3-methyl-5-hydroxy-6-metoxy-1,4-benzoquinol methylase